jgi:hypothetical protein
MSEQDNEQTEAPVAAPISADSFREVAALLTLVTETRACKARLRELRQAAALADKARAELEAARAAHDALIVKERAELEVRSTALRERELKVHAAEGLLAAHEAIYAEQKAALDRRQNRVQHFPGGMTRDLPVGHSDETPVEDQQVRDDDFHAVAGTTISRSKPRHTMRRIQDI